MNEYFLEMFSATTAEDEQNYFTGQPYYPDTPDPNVNVPPGNYRLIDGNLYRIYTGVPVNMRRKENSIQASKDRETIPETNE
jgi:hypothetical protein